MNPSQEFDLENAQIEPIPVVLPHHHHNHHEQQPLDSYPCGIADVLDNSLPEGTIDYSFHAPIHHQQHQVLGEPLHDLNLRHDNLNWTCHKCGVCNAGDRSVCCSCQGWKDDTLDCNENFTINNHDQTEWQCSCGYLVGSNKDKCESCNGSRGYKQKSPEETFYGDNWSCDTCAHLNGHNKVRCAACSRWKGGKRPNHAFPPILAPVDPFAREDWACDTCGISNGRDKVRCVACSRWKGGKRHATKFAITGNKTVATQGKNWICHGCSTINNKSRCRNCQNWKGGRRENLPKRTPPPTFGSSETTPWECDSCGHANGPTKTRCGCCQHWKDGRRLNMRVKSQSDTVGMVAAKPKVCNPDNLPWQCAKCGQGNDATKLRCRSCQSWKNCKQQQVGAAALTPAKEDDYQMNQMYPYTVGVTEDAPPAPPATAFESLPGPSPETQEDAAQQQQQQPATLWMCPHCNKENLATKVRCGGCQKWKGGVRDSYKSKKPKASPWNCRNCHLENAGNKVRCKACQCWKDGGRPDVLARKALAKESSRMGSWWQCDRCDRLNKPRNQRCGGCQHWRGGCRPQMKKKAPPMTQQFPAVPYPFDNMRPI